MFSDARAIFFDVDDTLYDFDASMGAAFAHLHKTFPDAFAKHTVDALADAYWGFYKAYGEQEKVALINGDPERFRRVMWAGALDRLGIQDSDFAERLTQEFALSRHAQWREAMYPGARDLLARLKGKKLIGAITNGPALVQRPKLQAIGHAEFFPEHLVFVSGEFGARKPDPKIFLAAAKAAGVAPTECVMVGDAREFDMPAKAIGFRTILFLGPRDAPDTSRDPHPPDAVARTYDEVARLLGA